MHTRLASPLRWIGLASLLALSLPCGPARAHGDAPTERWYEQLRLGKKVGHIRVVWAPSTWEGRKTVRDTTTFVTATQRDMAGMKDTFRSTVTLELERGEDGTRWWQRTRSEEAGRTIVEELRWTGSGYEIESRVGTEKAPVIRIALDTPVMTDAESFLGQRLKAGTVEPDQSFALRMLDVAARTARDHELVVLGRETIADEHGKPCECVLVREREPTTGGETRLWFDSEGVLVRLEGEGGIVIQRTTRDAAERMPARPAEFAITVPADPPLERVFAADRLLLDLHIQGETARALPEFPDSPWSRVLGKSGSDEEGWILETELRAYDSEDKQATIPLQGAEFVRYLEPTALMQVSHPLIRETVEEVLDGENDARRAAYRLSRYVYETLEKQSPDVGQADALQILRDCRGDCSEHCLLFVTLCRAAGIPARRCSGYVCIGSMWGSHAWAEVWTGQWIGADPTTGEIGTGARYLFFGYSDGPEPYPGVTSSRAEGRMRFVATRIEEGQAVLDLSDPAARRLRDDEGRNYLSVLTGLEAREVPEDWRVLLDGGGGMNVTGPGLSAVIRASADQGMNVDSMAGSLRGQGIETTFGGAPALLLPQGTVRYYLVFSRRRIVQVIVSRGDAEQIARLEQVIGPTFRPEPLPWPVAKDEVEPPDAPAEPVPAPESGER